MSGHDYVSDHHMCASLEDVSAERPHNLALWSALSLLTCAAAQTTCSLHAYLACTFVQQTVCIISAVQALSKAQRL